MKDIKINLIPVILLSMISFFSCNAQDITLKEGDTAPDFSLFSDEGILIKLSDYNGVANVVLYFYPKDQTPGCTKEACNFRDNISIFRELNAVILGVSVDDVESHRKFKESENLNFTLLADTDKEVSRKYSGVNMIGFANRVTFVIDKKGIIRKIYPKVDVSENYKEIIEDLKSMN